MASASAPLYQVPGTTPGAKSENTDVAPAEPSTPEVGLQVSGAKLAPTYTGTSLFSTEPQRSAANW